MRRACNVSVLVRGKGKGLKVECTNTKISIKIEYNAYIGE